MNLLSGTRVYLCGFMEYADGEGWRNQISPALQEMNITTFNPYLKPFINPIAEDNEARLLLKQWMIDGEFEKVTARMKAVRNDDLRLVDLSDFLIIYIKPTVPSWGTPEELFWGNREKKPIFLIVEGGKTCCPLWLMGTIPHKYIYSNVKEVIDMLRKIDSGEKELDNVRWRLLREEYR